MDQNTNTYRHGQQQSNQSPQYVLYRHLTEISLRQFIDVSVHQNFSSLIKSGLCDDKVALMEAWAALQDEYVSAIGDSEVQVYTSLFQQIKRLEAQIDKINILVKELERFYVKQFVDMVNEILGTQLKFDVSDPQAYNKDLRAVISRAKNFKVSLELKRQRFEELSKKRPDGEPVTEEYFQSWLLVLWRFLGSEVTDSITVFKYCQLIKMLNKHLKEIEEKTKK